MTRRGGLCGSTALMLALAACGGGGGVSSTPSPTPTPSPDATSTPTPTPPVTPTPSPSTPTPTPTPTPTATPTPTPTPSAVFDTPEYRLSNGVVFHGAISAYQKGASGAGVIVGVVDSGLSDPTGEFTGRISSASKGFVGGSSYADKDGHGTAVSTVIAGGRNDRHILGVAWNATVMALRTDDQNDCDADGCTHPTSAIADAIDHAWQNGAKVINISLGGGTPPMNLLQAVSRATAAGTIIVIAAGNNPDGGAPLVTPDGLAQAIADPLYSHGLVIVASSVDENDRVSAFSAGVSGFERLSLAAMGNRVVAIDHSGAEFLYSGTSFAAPQIAGAAALLAQAFPNLTSRQIVELLLSSARDVGAPGADARYGVGILDIAAAFAPRGTLGLAGSGTAIATMTSSALPTAMGDAVPARVSAVALDNLDRAYRVDLTPRFAGRSPVRSFASALDTTQRHVTGGTSDLGLALSIAPGRGPFASSALMLHDEDRSRFLSGSLQARLSPRAAIALGLRTGLTALESQLAGRGGPGFLMADNGFASQRADRRAASALALSYRLGRGLALTGGFETGEMIAGARRAGLPDPVTDRAAPYHAIALSLGLERRAFAMTAGLTLLDEPASTLGARFAPALGAQSAGTLFARLGARLEPADGLTLSANWQRGWTRAASGGFLRNGGSLVSQSWSADIARRNLFTANDLFGVRIAQPLRVIASRFDLILPDQWDWESRIATDHAVPLTLVPRGRQRDYELSYGRGIGPGWLGANLYAREQGGNVAAMPVDVGMALRWSMGF